MRLTLVLISVIVGVVLTKTVGPVIAGFVVLLCLGRALA